MSVSVTLSAASTARVDTSSRDARLDFIRGLALVMIFIDHTSGNGFAAMTLRAFGFADAAEVFVFIAGMAAFYAYRKRFAQSFAVGVSAVLARVRTLYLAHLVASALVIGLAVAVIAAGSSFDIATKLGLAPLAEDPVAAGVRLVMLGYQPHYLDILPLYVVLLAAFPLLMVASRVHVALPLVLAGTLYAFAQVTALNLPNLGNDGWFLNPFAWLLLFAFGVFAANMTQRGLWDQVPRAVLFAITLLAASYVVFALLVAAPWRAVTEFAGISSVLAVEFKTDKSLLSWHRLLDVLAKAWLVAVFVPRTAAFMERGLGGVFSAMGRRSLPVFVLGILLSLFGSVLLHEMGNSIGDQALVTLLGFAAMAGLALSLEAERAGLLAWLRRQANASRLV